jgi:hypothetical protein
MKPDQITPILATAFKSRFPILLTSSPGQGKTSLVEQVTKEIGYKLITLFPVMMDAVDMRGLPNFKDGKAQFTEYGELEEIITTQENTVVFLDDIGNSTPSLQAAAMNLILARQINGKHISDKVTFVAATNRRKDATGVSGLIRALISRFNTIIELENDIDSWCKWALRKESNMPLELISFVQFRPNLFLGKTLKVENGVEKWEDTPVNKEIENFVCARTVANLGKWIKAGVIDLETWSGCVGRGFATEFMAFYKTFTKIAGLPKKIILDPLNSEVPKEQDVIFALTAALSYQANETNFDAIMQYVERIPAEFAVFFLKYTITREPKLTETNAFINWNVKNQGVII